MSLSKSLSSNVKKRSDAQVNILSFFSAKKTKTDECEDSAGPSKSVDQCDKVTNVSSEESTNKKECDYLTRCVGFEEIVSDTPHGHTSTTNADTPLSETPLSVCSRLDLGLYLGSHHNITDDLRKELIETPYTPDISFKFPSSGPRNLKFQWKWLSTFPWLVYSAAKDGALCKYCVLFSTCVGQQSAPPGKLVVEPYKKWKNAKADFKSHGETNYHGLCVKKAANFISIRTGKQQAVDIQVDKALQMQISNNRERLKPIIRTAMFCAREGFSFRGHRDTGPIDLNNENSKGEGHFRALLRFRVEAGDDILKNHLLTAPANATHYSWRIQNEIISSFNVLMIKKIVKLINEAICFSVLADETTDISGEQQMSFCIRFVDSTMKLREEFLQFFPVHNATGAGLADTILKGMAELGLNTDKLVGQGYDGASAMSGAYRGVQALIQERFPKALYVHCSAHSLNLAVSNSCGISHIRNCMGTIEKTYCLFNYPKRKRTLYAEIEKLESKPRAQKLKRLCETRWIERHDAVSAFLELIEPISASLSTISTWDDKNTATEAQLLSCAIQRSEFVISLFVLDRVFSLTLPLSKYLQTVNIDLSLAVSSAMNVKESLQVMRNTAEKNFSDIFQVVEDICEKLDVSISKPRTVSRQTDRSNIPVETPEDYYRISIFIPFLDSFILQLNEKFSKHKDILQPFQYLLSCHHENTQEVLEKVKILAEFYGTPTSVAGELILWHQTLSSIGKNPQSAIDAIPLCNKNLFPGIYELLHIMATLPVTTCEPERSFSTLKLLKTYLRNTMGNDRLNGLALMYIHRDILIDEEEVLNELAKKPRRTEIRLK